MSHSALCRIRHYVAFGIMSHSTLCRIRGYVVRHNVIRQYVAFGLMLFGIMSHSALCCIRPYVVRLCVVRRIVIRRNVVWHNVGVLRNDREWMVRNEGAEEGDDEKERNRRKGWRRCARQPCH